MVTTTQEIIEQVDKCNTPKVVANPFVKIFLRLKNKDKEAIAEELFKNNISIFDADNHVNAPALLCYLWPILTGDQKKSLIPSVEFLLKEHGIKIVDLVDKTDIDLIFANIDLTTLAWQWKDIKQILERLSEAERKKHIKRYFKPFMLSILKNSSFPDEKFKALLDSLTEPECCWIFMNMDFNQFMSCLPYLDFLFNYLSSKNRFNVLKRLDSEAFFKCINDSSVFFFLGRSFKRFIENFDLEDRKNVVLLLKPEHLQTIIDTFSDLQEILKMLPEVDRLWLLQYVGYDHIKKLINHRPDAKRDVLVYLLGELLLPAHRVIFLLGFDKLYLQLIYNDWETFASITNLLPENDDEVFLDYIGSHISSILDNLPGFLKQLLPEKRFLFITKIENTRLKELVEKSGIKAIVFALPDENRIEFVLLVHKLFPEILKEAFADIKEFKASFLFSELMKLIPEKHRFSFFELLPEEHLLTLHQTYYDNNIKESIGAYLKAKHITISFQDNLHETPDVVDLPDPAESLPTDDLVSLEPVPFAESIFIKTGGLSYINLYEAPLQSLHTLHHLSSQPSCSKSQHNLHETPVKLDNHFFQPQVCKPVKPKQKTCSNIFEKLDTHIQYLKINSRYHGTAYQDLEYALIALKNAMHSQLLKERDKGNYSTLEECWTNSPLQPIMKETIFFLDRFLPENTHIITKQFYIQYYENKIQPAKTMKTIGRGLGVVIIAALCAVTGAAMGLGIGLLAGSWTGPGALVTGFAGLAAGANSGWTIGGITACAAVAGVGGALAGYTFFKPSPVQSATGQIIRCSKKIVQEEIKKHDEQFSKKLSG